MLFHVCFQLDGPLQGIAEGVLGLHEGGTFPEHPAYLQWLQFMALATPDSCAIAQACHSILVPFVIVVISHEDRGNASFFLIMPW
jgi:hypothetical protein